MCCTFANANETAAAAQPRKYKAIWSIFYPFSCEIYYDYILLEI